MTRLQGALPVLALGAVGAALAWLRVTVDTLPTTAALAGHVGDLPQIHRTTDADVADGRSRVVVVDATAAGAGAGRLAGTDVRVAPGEVDAALVEHWAAFVDRVVVVVADDRGAAREVAGRLARETLAKRVAILDRRSEGWRAARGDAR